MSIPFTQYMLPDGRVKKVLICMPDEIESRAKALIGDDCRFEIEMLSSGEISMTCERDDEVLSIEVCQNGPDVLLAVERLIDVAEEQLGRSGQGERSDE